MASLNIIIKPKNSRSRKVVVEFNADEFERIAAHFGFLNPEIVKRLNKAKKDIKAGKIRKINSLKDLR